MGHMDPIAHYRALTPSRAGSKRHAQDVALIKASSHRMETAKRLLEQRSVERIMQRIDKELDQLGRKKPIYDQGAVLLIEHLWPYPHLDPTTQRPIFRRLLESAKAKTLHRREFIEGAVAILRQDYLLPAGS